MYIHEAAREAAKEGKLIAREGWSFRAGIEPTNMPECCIVHLLDTGEMRPCWNPQMEDLLADDWRTAD